MGNYSSDKLTVYRSVRLSRDAKHFPKTGDKPAATYLSFWDQTKDGEDIPVDACVRRGAELLAGLKKGDFVDVTAPEGVLFSKNESGRIIGKIWSASVSTQVRLKDRASAGAAVDSAAPASDSEAPAFE